MSGLVSRILCLEKEERTGLSEDTLDIELGHGSEVALCLNVTALSGGGTVTAKLFNINPDGTASAAAVATGAALNAAGFDRTVVSGPVKKFRVTVDHSTDVTTATYELYLDVVE